VIPFFLVITLIRSHYKSSINVVDASCISSQTNKNKPHHPWYSSKTLTYGKIFVSAFPCYFVYYEGESKSKGKIHLMALIAVTVSNITYHFST